MNGILSQLITLTTYGNEYIRNGKLPVDFYPAHPAFNFCNQVDFIDLKGGGEPVASQNEIVATNPTDWLIYLKNNNCKDLKLYFQYSGNKDFPDYKSAGMVGGGGYWRIEANYKDNCDIWASRWAVTKEDDPERKIWTVNYGLLAKGQPPSLMPCNLKIIKEETKERLSAIFAFSIEQKLDSWAKIFEKALGTLNSNEPADNTHTKTMIPLQNYSLIARQLLFTAEKMHVFGAMGSWNDLGFDDKNIQEEYEQLSYDLYDNICVNIIAAVNSY